MSNEKLLAYGVKMGLVSYPPIPVKMHYKKFRVEYHRWYRRQNRQMYRDSSRAYYTRTKNPRVNKHTGININQSTEEGRRAYMREYRRLRADA